MPDDFIGCGMNASLEDLLGTKKKKKTDKGQAQLNKCLNEKRRREQENLYIEEIAELISASMTDMSNFSVKPDKCAILQETVNQIRRIKQEVSGQSDAVQQSQVSSSKPTILASDVLGPILLEALDGFLFVVNSQGKVEFVSDNVTQFLKYPQDDLVGKSIYNIIHVGDHAQFSNSLLPMSLGNCLSWAPADNPVGKSRTFNCRMLIKNPGEEEDELEAKQTAVSQYENMQISAVLQPYPCDKDADTPPTKEQGETQYCLVCIARRLGFAEKTGGMLGVEQFTIKQDLQGKILAFDTSRITPSHFNYPDFVGQNIQDFCHINDVQQLTKHHQEVLKCGSSTSSVFRFKLSENRYVFVQTRSKLFTANNKPEFIMSTHSIVRECDSDTELKGSASTSLMKSIIGQNSGAKRETEDMKSPTGLIHPLLGGGGGSQTNTGLLLGGGSMTNLAAGMGSLGNLANMPAELDISNDSVNIDDVIGSLLSSGNNWDNTLATPSASLPMSGSTNPQGGVSSSSTHTPVTHVSWSNMSSVNVAHGNSRSLPLNMPSRNMMGMKSPVSPGFANQRSPGFAAQRSPGFAPQMSPIPSPGAGQKSPAAVGMGGFQCPANPGVPRASPSIRNSISSTSQTSCTFDDDDLNSILESLQQSASAPSKNTQLMRPPAGKGRTGGQSQSNWSSSQQSPLQALKSLEAQAGSRSQASKLSQASAIKSKENSYVQEYYLVMDKKLDKRSQIRDLIAHEKDAPIINGKKSQAKSLPDGSQPLQSPTPGPGQSPKNTSPQQPQSTTSNEESHPDSSRDSISSKNSKAQNNVILKQLLSQEDSNSDDDQDVFQDSASSSNGPIIKAKSATSDSADDMEKNEAEPKKLDNALLKQLLNDDTNLRSQDESKKKGNSSHLLQKLLLENDPDCDSEENKTLAKAESTSQESIDKSMDDTFASLLDSNPGSSSGIDEALLKNVLGTLNSNLNNPPSVNKSNQKPTNLEVYLSNLWEKQTEMDNKPNLKRKASDTDLVDSTDMDMDPVVNSGSGQSKLSKRNVLLAQLLSKKTTKENVVNTQLTVNPASTPQLRLPKNLADKIIDIGKDSEGKGGDKTPLGASDSNVIKSEGKRPSQWDNPCTNPNSPFPGNTKDNAGNQPSLQGGGPSTAGITSMDTSSGPMGNLNVKTGPNNIVSSSTTESAMATSSADGQDPLLSQILQQVTELQNDFSAANQGASGASVNLDQSMTDDTNLLKQLELVLNSSNISLQEIDSMLGINSQQSQQFNNMSEQMAINVIEQQLLQGMDSATQPQQQGMQQKMSNKQQIPEGLPPSSQSVQTNAITPQSQMAAILGQGQDPAQQQQAIEAMLIRQQQHQQQQSQQHMVNPLNQQGIPRFPNAQGIQNLFQQPQQQPGSSVRQSLIMQQRQKAMRQQKQQQHHQRQERQRLLEQQERQQYNLPQAPFQQGQQGHGGVPENFNELMNTTMAPNVSLQRSQSMGATPGSISPRGFPVVGNPGLQQQGMSPMIRGNNPQNRLSPFASGAPGGNPAAGGRQNQWNQRANQAMMAGGSVVQTPQFGNMNRMPNNMGPNVPQSPQGSEQFSQFGQGDGQFGPGQGTQHGGGHGPGHGQNQQMGQAPAMMSPNHPQSRMIGRQMSMPGAGPSMYRASGMNSPRGGGQQSPFGGQDPLLMSPHSQNLSPNQQVSPQGQINVPMSQAGMNQIAQATSLGLSQQMNMGGQQSFPPMGQQGPGVSPQAGSQMGQSPNLQQNFTPEMFQLAQERNKMVQNNGQGGNTSQYVKQELRGLINTRTQNQQAISDPVASLDSELPMEIFESLNEMQRQQQQSQQLATQTPQQQQQQQQQFMPTSMASRTATTNMDPLANDDMALSSARKEASVRYEKFRQLSFAGTQERLGHGSMEPAGPNGKAWPQWKPDDPEIKATNVFRNQLVGGVKQEPPPATKKKPLDPNNVHVVQKEPRTPIDDIKPADQKNSLLQQLLSSD